MPYSINNPQPLQLTLSSVERFHDSYNYYILDGEVPDNAVGCPVVNGNGQVVGIMHKSDSHTTAVDGAMSNNSLSADFRHSTPRCKRRACARPCPTMRRKPSP